MGASVWRVGQTAEDLLMYGRSVKSAMSRNGEDNCTILLCLVNQLEAL